MQANPISADSENMPHHSRLSLIHAVFAKQLSPEEEETIAADLQKNGTLIFSESGKVTYTEEPKASVDS